MIPVDKGGIAVFADESRAGFRRPMGVSFYSNPNNGKHYVLVSRKTGPDSGYIYQYELRPDGIDVAATLVRKFGKFSGKKEIEAIAVDHELGFVYYADEGFGIRKYHADPSRGDAELSLFGAEHFRDDIEGICIASYKDSSGYLIVSDQGANSFNVFSRENNEFVRKINLGTRETDGCEVTTSALGERFPNGLIVSMNNDRNFFFHSLDSLNLN
jgi:3-phytase